MKSFLRNFVFSLPRGSLLLVLLYALGFPLALAGHYTHTFDLYNWLMLSPVVAWKGEVWRLFTYAFLPNGVVDWAVSLFWLATLVAVLGRNWSGVELWVYCVLATVAGALVVALVKPAMHVGVVGNGAMLFGFLAAWYRLYGRERLILLGFGEISVRQATILVVLIEILISLFCLDWFVTLAMICGGLVGWFYLVLRGKHALNRHSEVLDSQRIARLEL
jgi:membrane associated rhomboid family serine protease